MAAAKARASLGGTNRPVTPCSINSLTPGKRVATTGKPLAMASSIAIPNDSKQYGYLSEHHPFGETDEKAGEYAEDDEIGQVIKERVKEVIDEE